jgi:hypothetical protein
LSLLCADKPTGAEIVIVLDDKAHLEVVLRIRASNLCILIENWCLFLGLENLFELLATMTGLEEA